MRNVRERAYVGPCARVRGAGPSQRDVGGREYSHTCTRLRARCRAHRCASSALAPHLRPPLPRACAPSLAPRRPALAPAARRAPRPRQRRRRRSPPGSMATPHAPTATAPSGATLRASQACAPPCGQRRPVGARAPAAAGRSGRARSSRRARGRYGRRAQRRAKRAVCGTGGPRCSRRVWHARAGALGGACVRFLGDIALNASAYNTKVCGWWCRRSELAVARLARPLEHGHARQHGRRGGGTPSRDVLRKRLRVEHERDAPPRGVVPRCSCTAARSPCRST